MEEICSIKRNCFEACDEISGESLQQPELARKEETFCVWEAGGLGRERCLGQDLT